jgi:tetratricopeptide (TPR) repeat protein
MRFRPQIGSGRPRAAPLARRALAAAARLAADRRLLGAAAALGVVSLLVALTGGPVAALGFELPTAETAILRSALAILGGLLLAAAAWVWVRFGSDGDAQPTTHQPQPGRPEANHLRASPYQLPRDLPYFTGRAETVADLVGFLERGGDQRGTALPVVAIAGKAGVGKTALAVHVAHLVRHFYPDGQLYADLRVARDGPLELDRVLGDFLLSLGVARRHIPDEEDARARLYRELLSDRRVLIVLDDASGEAQVRPLLPGGVGCAVIVTSRARLSALDGARMVELDVFEPDAAVDLLASVVGAQRVAAEREAAIAIAGLCGYLPLAVGIAGALLAKPPIRSLADLVGSLMDERRRLSELSVGDREVRASFLVSYREPEETERRAFCMLSLLTVEDFAAWVLAALVDWELDAARRAVERLVDTRLVEDAGRDVTGLWRFRFHDLLRLFARERLEAEESAVDRRAALERTLHAYLALAIRADSELDPHAMRYAKVTPPRGWQGVDRTVLDAVAAAPLGWFEVERLNLMALLRQAEEAGLWRLVCALGSRMSRYFSIHAHWQNWQDTTLLIQQAATRHGDRFGQALAAYNLGVLHQEQGRYEQALIHLGTARSWFRQLSDRRGEAHTLVALAVVHGEQRRWPEAITECEQAVLIFQEYGMHRAEAYALRTLSNLYRLTGRWDEAVNRAQRSLRLYEAAGDRLGEAWVRRYVGDVCRDRGQLDEALPLFELALEGFRRFGDRGGQSRALRGLGIVHRERGEFDQATACLHESLAIAQRLGDRITEARVLVSWGVLHRYNRDWERAERCFALALPIARRYGDRHEQADALHSLGVLYAEQNQLVDALDHLQRALDLFRRCQSPLWEAKTLAYIGHVHALRGEQAAATKARQDAGKLAQRLGIRMPRRPPPGQASRSHRPATAPRAAGGGDALPDQQWPGGPRFNNRTIEDHQTAPLAHSDGEPCKPGI